MISQMGEKNGNQSHSDFSIEHILTRAGNTGDFSHNYNISQSQSDSSVDPAMSMDTFAWLQCTRYCPPKIPRIHKKEGPPKRQPGRHPRIPFTRHQLSVLEGKFRESPYLSSEEVSMLSRELQLADIRVKIWFQNRRARERRERNVPPAAASHLSNQDEDTSSQLAEKPLDFSSHLKDSHGCFTSESTSQHDYQYCHQNILKVTPR